MHGFTCTLHPCEDENYSGFGCCSPDDLHLNHSEGILIILLFQHFFKNFGQSIQKQADL